MFARSAASDTLQGKAIQEVNEKWGEDILNRSGRETLGLPVCKKKYKPFCPLIETLKDGTKRVKVIRMYACSVHQDLRKSVIEKRGLRKGWEDYGRWSMKKAVDRAKIETNRLNHEEATGDEESEVSEEEINLCQNGECAWKLRTAFDNIYKEIHGVSEDEEES